MITENSREETRKIKIFIVGAGKTGETVLALFKKEGKENEILGFVDDNESKKGSVVSGKKIYGNINDLPFLIKQFDANEIIIAIPSKRSEITRRVLSLTAETNAVIKIIADNDKSLDKNTTLVEYVRKVNIEDLLIRSRIKMDLSLISKYFNGKVVLITGAGGSIGSELTREIRKFNPSKIILLGRGENRIFSINREIKEKDSYFSAIPVICDIKNKKKIDYIFEKYKPEIVIHAAAHKHLGLMEKNPDEAITNNILGTKILLDASLKYGSKIFINLSTDKAVEAVSYMGASKRIVEMMLQYYNGKNGLRCASVRFANVLDTSGNVITAFAKQLEESRTLRITDPNMERYFMLTSEAVQLVLQSIPLIRKNDIFILNVGEPIRIEDLAKNYIKLSGYELGYNANITIIGNENNEKRVEKLYPSVEKIEKTENEKILRVISPKLVLDEKSFNIKIDKLISLAENMEMDEATKILEELDSSIKLSLKEN